MCLYAFVCAFVHACRECACLYAFSAERWCGVIQANVQYTHSAQRAHHVGTFMMCEYACVCVCACSRGCVCVVCVCVSDYVCVFVRVRAGVCLQAYRNRRGRQRLCFRHCNLIRFRWRAIDKPLRAHIHNMHSTQLVHENGHWPNDAIGSLSPLIHLAGFYKYHSYVNNIKNNSYINKVILLRNTHKFYALFWSSTRARFGSYMQAQYNTSQTTYKGMCESKQHILHVVFIPVTAML